MTTTFDDAPGNADWLRATWDVRTKDGQPVTTLDALATELDVEPHEAAEMLLTTPFGKAAPEGLRAEAEKARSGAAVSGWDEAVGGTPNDVLAATEREVEPLPDEEGEPGVKAFGGKQAPPFGGGKGGKGKPDKAGEGSAKVARGDFVEWSGGKGKVDLVVTAGVVPGVDGKPVFGSKSSPAARVRKYAKDGNGWKATDDRIAVKGSDLTKIDDLPKPERKVLDDAPAALVDLAARYDGVVEAKALRTAFERGLAGWPGEEKTALPRERWALGRAAALVHAAEGNEVQGFRDADLLP